MPRLTAYILRRCLALIPQLLAISFVTFVLARLLPGDPVALILGPMSTTEARDNLRAEMHLDQPFYIQYYYYLRDLLSGDLGRAWTTSNAVLDDLIARFPATLRADYLQPASRADHRRRHRRGDVVPAGRLGRPGDAPLRPSGRRPARLLARLDLDLLLLFQAAHLPGPAWPPRSVPDAAGAHHRHVYGGQSADRQLGMLLERMGASRPAGAHLGLRQRRGDHAYDPLDDDGDPRRRFHSPGTDERACPSACSSVTPSATRCRRSSP